MAALDSLFFGLSKSLIDQFGGSASLQTISETFTPATGLTSETVAAQAVKISPPDPVDLSAVDGSLVQAGDMTTLIAAKGLTSAPVANSSRLVFDGDTWQAVGVEPIYSGDDIAAYRIQLRR